MDYKDLLAIVIFAIDRDLMSLSFEEVWYAMCNYVGDCCDYYDITPIDVVDKLIYDAQERIKNGISYGKYDASIMKITLN